MNGVRQIRGESDVYERNQGVIVFIEGVFCNEDYQKRWS